MTTYWKYVTAGKSKMQHAFGNLVTSTSLCGYTIPWYSTQKWKTDKEGLKKRKKCSRCRRLSRAPHAPAEMQSEPRSSSGPGPVRAEMQYAALEATGVEIDAEDDVEVTLERLRAARRAVAARRRQQSQ